MSCYSLTENVLCILSIGLLVYVFKSLKDSFTFGRQVSVWKHTCHCTVYLACHFRVMPTPPSYKQARALGCTMRHSILSDSLRRGLWCREAGARTVGFQGQQPPTPRTTLLRLGADQAESGHCWFLWKSPVLL